MTGLSFLQISRNSNLNNTDLLPFLLLLPICYRVLQEIIHCKPPGANNSKTLAGLCTFLAPLAENLFPSSVSKASRGAQSPSHAVLLLCFLLLLLRTPHNCFGVFKTIQGNLSVLRSKDSLFWLQHTCRFLWRLVFCSPPLLLITWLMVSGSS